MTSSKWLRAAVSGLAAAGFAGLSLLGAAWAGDEDYNTSRVVSIGGSLTEIVYALGEEGRLVARDSTSVFPTEANELPDVGYMRALSPEGVLSVDPSLILLLEGSGPPEALDVLEKASIPLVTVPDRFDRDGIIEKIKIIGGVLGAADKADRLAAEVSDAIEATRALTADVKERKKVLFVLSLQGGRVLASGVGTAADGIIAMAGGVNAVTAFTGYKQLSDEALIEAAPDVILAMDRGGDLNIQAAELLAHPAIAATPAAADKKVVRMDGAFLLGFGPRTAAAARELAGALYGNAIGVH